MRLKPERIAAVPTTLKDLMPTLHLGRYAFVDQGDSTVLYDVTTETPLVWLSAVEEYALARMLIEKFHSADHVIREQGEALYRDEVSVVGRGLALS